MSDARCMVFDVPSARRGRRCEMCDVRCVMSGVWLNNFSITRTYDGRSFQRPEVGAKRSFSVLEASGEYRCVFEMCDAG